MRAAQPEWSARGVAGCAQALADFSAALSARRAELGAALTTDTGRIPESMMEVDAVVDAIAHWCEQAPRLLAPSYATDTRVPFVTSRLGYTPYAVVGIIAPWNFPLLLSFIDAIPALLAGCAVVLKPSEITPRFVEPLLGVLDDVPALAAALRIVQGGADVGQALVGQVDTLCFTGSVAIGKQVARAAAEHFIPAHLELGGKDPALVFADADMGRAAAAISWGGTVNAGQSCLSIERVYVEQTAFDPFVALLVAATSTLQINHPDINTGQIGPLISATQAGIIERHLADAVAKGATVHCGGQLVRDGGVWCPPTVLTNVDHSMLVMREETFAPILPVMAFDDEAQAVTLANDTSFGLSAAVFTSDAVRLPRVAAAIEAGAVSANDVCLTSFIHEGAKQAFKDSGLGGSRMGDSAITRFFRRRTVLENTDLAWDPWWFQQSEGGRI